MGYWRCGVDAEREGRSALVLPAELRLSEVKDEGSAEALWWFDELDTLLR